MKTVPVSEKADRSYTLPAAAYIEPQILDLEKETIFFRSWLFAGHICELSEPGNYITRQIFDQSVLIIKGTDAEIRAFYNVCSHRAHELLSGSGQTERIQCPYHAWSYHINGTVNTIPGSDQMELEKGEFCLKSVRSEIFGSMIFINLDEEAESLASLSPQVPGEIDSYFPDLDKVTLLSSSEHASKSNWKANVDNFVEFYHYGATHHSSAELDSSNYQIVNHPNHIYQVATPEASDSNDAEITPEQLHKQLAFWYLWPNTGFSVFPGSPFVMVTTFEPDDADTGRMHMKIYGPAEMADDKVFEDFRKARASILQEDVAACESVQRGLHSKGYNQGRFIIDEDQQQVSESGVHHFHLMVLQALES
jgi:choline monooxygenase